MHRSALPASTPSRTSFARQLRSGSTEAENRLWYYLRDRRLQGAKFRRQVPIGPYVVDFLCVSVALIVEVDGGQHSSRVAHDEARTRFLETRGYRVVRFWNNDVMGDIAGAIVTVVDGNQRAPRPAS